MWHLAYWTEDENGAVWDYQGGLLPEQEAKRRAKELEAAGYCYELRSPDSFYRPEKKGKVKRAH